MRKLALTLALVSKAMLGVALTAAAADVPPAPPPSIVFILSDDEDVGSHWVMEKTKALIEDQGASLANYFVSYSFCCPSRATILRGQYPHNHRIEGNEWPTGGYQKFHALGLDNSTIATWLHAAGYRTAFLGKLMNGYEPEQAGPAPGWDDWYAVGNKYRNFDYTLNENGTVMIRPSNSGTATWVATSSGDMPSSEPAHQARSEVRQSPCSMGMSRAANARTSQPSSSSPADAVAGRVPPAARTVVIRASRVPR